MTLHNGATSTEKSAQVIIVGAGPVGLFTAVVLASHGIKVLVLEAESAIIDSPRAISYQACILAEFHEAGVLKDVEAVSVKNTSVSYWIGHEPEKKCLANVAKIEGFKTFPAGLNCGQPVLAGVFLKVLREKYGAEVLFNHAVTQLADDENGGVEVSCEVKGQHGGETKRFRSDWLVGADGARSTIRRQLGLISEGFTWPKENFVATNVYYPFMKYGYSTANMVVDPVSWAIVSRIDANDLWRVAFGVPVDLTDEEIKAIVPERFKKILPGPGTGYNIIQINKYKPHQRCASRLRKGHCFLAGDAAHMNNPIGGLGLTTGLLDAGPLARALIAVIKGRAPDSLLDRWEVARRESFWKQTCPQSIENKRLVQQGGYGDDPLGIWERDEVAEKNDMIPWLQNAVPEAKAKDISFFEAVKDKKNQLKARMRQWDIAMPIDWMADYEDLETRKARRALWPPMEGSLLQGEEAEPQSLKENRL